jgi:glycosyltransferase involved in cell wall biosynthesis
MSLIRTPGPPRISVVIPCYNAERYVAATLRSVLAQTLPAAEVIVVDDGSRDASAELVRSQFPGVTLLRQPNQGVAAARNRGIEHASGDWIAFVDADDIWLPGKLAAQWALLGSRPDARIAYTAWQVWHSTEPEPAPQLLAQLSAAADDEVRWAGASGWIYPELLLDCVVWTSTVLAERALLQQLGGFDAGLRIGEDYDLWLRASRVTPILRLPRPGALYRMHPQSITKGAPAKNHKGEVVGRALQRWGYASPDGRSARRSDVDRGLARSWSDFGGAHLSGGNLRIARQAALTAVRLAPTQVLGWKVLAKAALGMLAGAGGPTPERRA